MDPRQLFSDERFNGVCAFCGNASDTNDHIPSKVLLDTPYPEDLPGVGACFPCNNGFSLDEEYLASFIECVICGTTDPALLRRTKIQKILQRKPALAAQIEAAKRQSESGQLIWVPEAERVRNVVLKLARGHAAFAFSEPRLDEPEQVAFVPLATLSEQQRRSFETVNSEGGLGGWPEIGSRAFLQLFAVGGEVFNAEGGWTVLQEGRYRYALPDLDGFSVRMVLSEYLACEVVW